MAEVFVFVDVGCLECSLPSEIVAVSPDLEVIQAEWAKRLKGATWTIDYRASHNDEWPENVVALKIDSQSAYVVYRQAVT